MLCLEITILYLGYSVLCLAMCFLEVGDTVVCPGITISYAGINITSYLAITFVSIDVCINVLSFLFFFIIINDKIGYLLNSTLLLLFF